MNRLRVRHGTAARSDEGIALITVLGVIAVVTVLVVGTFAMAEQSLHDSNRTNQESQAFQAANAALDAAVARIQHQGYTQPTSTPTPPFLAFPASATGSGSATVTVDQISNSEYVLRSEGRASDGTTETVRVRMYFIDLYGMNVSYGARLDANASNGKVNGTTSIYGPLYTYGSLNSDNLGSGAGGIKWGPLMVKGGDVSSAHDYIDVGSIYYEPPHTIVVGTTPQPRMIPSVPDFVVPAVDSTYLQGALARAQKESADNNQGEPEARPGVTNQEVTTPLDTTTYNSLSPRLGRAAGAVSTYTGYAGAYKVIDGDGTINRSSGLTFDATTPSFGNPTDDFAWNAATRTLTVWGTVFIDGPLTTATDFEMWYVGNGVIVANGTISLLGRFTPLNGLSPGLGGNNGNITYANQSFNKDETLGFVTPDLIILDNAGGNPGTDPDTPPSHAGAFYCVNPNGMDPDLGLIQMGTKTSVVGSVIARGIDFLENNNQHLRTSANLGQCVSHTMPGYGQMVQSFGTWARQ